MSRRIVPFLTLRRLAPVAAMAALAGPALAGEIRSVSEDSYGNAIIRTTGGAKIIAVGRGAELVAAHGTAHAAPGEPEIIPAAPVCREVGIVLRGRGFMYGLSDGDPVPVLTQTVCD